MNGFPYWHRWQDTRHYRGDAEMSKRKFDVWTYDYPHATWLAVSESLTRDEADETVARKVRVHKTHLTVAGAYIALPKGVAPKYTPENETGAVVVQLEASASPAPDSEPPDTPETPAQPTVSGDDPRLRISGTDFAAFQQGGQATPQGSYEQDVISALDTAVRARSGLTAAVAGLPGEDGWGGHEYDALALARQDVAEAAERLDRARVLIAGSRLSQDR